MQEFSEIAYGGAVTVTEWWDNKRIAAGTLATKQILKKASFYTYLGIGLPATLMSAFGWWKKGEKWTEHLSHGFLYDFPRFIYNIVQALRTTSASPASESRAVQEAKEILRREQSRQLGVGRPLSRTYQPEMEKVAPYAF
jgi:hypothetical protein